MCGSVPHEMFHTLMMYYKDVSYCCIVAGVCELTSFCPVAPATCNVLNPKGVFTSMYYATLENLVWIRSNLAPHVHVLLLLNGIRCYHNIVS